MRKPNPEHMKSVIDLINRGPYFQLLSMKVCDLGLGYSKVVVDLERKHLNPFGGIHGGVYSSLIDTAAYWAVYCDVQEDAGLISLDIKVDNLAPIKEGRLVVEGKRIKAGRSICIAEAAI
ncbi:MAG TPA: PaaI family thioesterase, partial [Lachnospiraceae bacterium]|nr:PaaI family thioesterase [Lachnospiraceae bacterium]